MPTPSAFTATGLSLAYARGEADPVAVTHAALEKAAKMPAVFLSLDSGRALAAAAASAVRWRQRRPLSALDGVPVAWKDLFDVAGMVTTAGTAIFRTRARAVRDAALVAAARRAGMVSIGKTGLSELAYSGLGLNPHFGTPTNPALDNGTRAPGGSSSGAAISVATGVVPISVGTDTAGSIRIPPAFNGLSGYRASAARYPREGITPLAPTLDTVGPVANSVADCAAFDAAVRGVANAAPPLSVRGQRFVVDPALIERYGVDDAVTRNTTRFVERLDAHGARIETRALATLARVHELIHARGWLGALEAFGQYRSLLDSDAARQLDPRVRTRLALARAMPATRLPELLAARTALIAQFSQELAGATLIAPTVAHVAPLLAPLEADPDLFAAVNLKTLALTMPGSFLDTPAIALPSGTDPAGLPTSIQLMRAQHEDDTLLALARSVESLPH